MPFDEGPENSGGGGGSDRDDQLISFVMDTLMDAIEAADDPEFVMTNVMLSTVGTFIMNISALPGQTMDGTHAATVHLINEHYADRRAVLQDAVENLMRARRPQ